MCGNILWEECVRMHLAIVQGSGTTCRSTNSRCNSYTWFKKVENSKAFYVNLSGRWLKRLIGTFAVGRCLFIHKSGISGETKTGEAPIRWRHRRHWLGWGFMFVRTVLRTARLKHGDAPFPISPCMPLGACPQMLRPQMPFETEAPPDNLSSQR